MSHGRFQSFHHHALVILMSCMTWWRFALLVFTHRTARQMLENIARPSQRFIVLLNLLFYQFFFLCRESRRFVLLLLRVHGWRENTRQRFHVFTLRHRNDWTTGACAGDPCYSYLRCVLMPSTLNGIDLAAMREMWIISFTKKKKKNVVCSYTLAWTF